MQPKDIITIVISSLAFVLSLVATVISIRRGKYERERTVRTQITDVLSRIASLNLEDAKLFHEVATNDPEHYINMSDILNKHQIFLLHQAMYLSDLVPTLVTSVEYTTIAEANEKAGDSIMAEDYYKKAIDATPYEYYKALAMRDYAGFLFTQHRFEDARKQLTESVSLLKGNNDSSRRTKGLTYQMWGWSEWHIARSHGRAQDAFDSARSEFDGIANEIVKKDALRGLNAARATLPPPPSTDRTNG